MTARKMAVRATSLRNAWTSVTPVPGRFRVPRTRLSRIRAFFDRTAPLTNAHRITKPLFVVQGANDPRVPRQEAEQIAAAVRKNGTPVWFLMAMDEGHGFAKKKNADFQFYSTVMFVREFLTRESAVP